MGNQLVERISDIIQDNLVYSFIILYLAAVFTVFGVQQAFRKDESTGIISTSEEEVTEVIDENIFVEIAGAINKPGVYELSFEGRLAEVVERAEGFSSDASEEWVSKYINLSGKLTDAQKIYIPFKWEPPLEPVKGQEVAALINPYTDNQTTLTSNQINKPVLPEEVTGKVNVNTASQEDIDGLSGIGPVYAARMIENRPYNDFQALVEDSGIPKNVLEKIEDQIGF